MYDHKPVDFGCVVLCPDRSARALQLTVRTMGHFTDAPCIAVVPKGTTRKITDEIREVCPLARGDNTYTSLINVGLQKSTKDWNFIFFAGVVIKSNFWRRYVYFMEDDKDIMFSVMAKHTNFVDGSLNGLFIHKNTIKRIGKMPEVSEIEQAKVTWAYSALQKGCRFKGILGMRLG